MKHIKTRDKNLDLNPDFRLFPFYFMKTLNYLYVRFVEGVRSINCDKTDSLLKELKDFQDDKTRLIIAFRHPTRHDPPILMRLIHTLIPKRAKKIGIKLNKVTHGHFVYGKWLLLWANPLAKWLFPGIGAIPVNNRSRDLNGIRNIRKILVNGDFPLALAPEGQVTYHNSLVGEMESGLSAMASWCKDDLKRAKDSKSVKVLPLTLYYDYSIGGKKSLNRVISKINSYLVTKEQDLLKLTSLILDEIEEFYMAYHYHRPEDLNLKERINHITDSILKRAENYFNLKSEGSFLDRTLNIRQEGASYIYMKVKNRTKGSKNRANYMASEAFSILRHNEIVDILQYIDPDYIDNDSLNRKIEYSLNLLDLINRFDGGNISTRFTSIPKKVNIISGKALVLEDYNNKTEKKEKLSSLHKQLYNELDKIGNLFK